MSASFVTRLGELKIPVTVHAYTGTHYQPCWWRDLQHSFPLILKVLGALNRTLPTLAGP